jgi:hypothetical protein
MDGDEHKVENSRNITPSLTSKHDIFSEGMLRLTKGGKSISPRVEMPMHLRYFSVRNILLSAMRRNPGKEEEIRRQSQNCHL